MSYLNKCIWTASGTSSSAFVVSASALGGYTPAQCANPSVIDGAPYRYSAFDAAGNHQEGYGTYSVSTSTLTSTSIGNSTNSGSAVTFTSAPVVIMGGPDASDIQSPATLSPTFYVDGSAGSDSNTGFALGTAATNAITATSSAVLHFASVPAFVVSGLSAFDSTTQQYLGSVLSTGSGIVTLSANVLHAVGSGDTIAFAKSFQTIGKALSVVQGYNYMGLYAPSIVVADGSYSGQWTLPPLVGVSVTQAALIRGSVVPADQTCPTVLTDTGTYYSLTTPPGAEWAIGAFDFHGTYGGYQCGALSVMAILNPVSFSGSFSQALGFIGSFGFLIAPGIEHYVTSTSANNIIVNDGLANYNGAGVKFANAITLSGSVYAGDASYSFGAIIGFSFVNASNVTCSGAANCLLLTNGAKLETQPSTVVDGVAISRANFPGHGSGGGVAVDKWSTFFPDGGNVVTVAPGTTTLAGLVFQAGTNLTTAAAGSAEFDGLAYYLTSVASSRQVVATEQIQVLSANRTLANNTSAQALFNATTNGAITLAGSTTYEFEMVANVTGLSSSSKNISLGFGGTATITSIQYFAELFNSTGTLAGGFITTTAATALLAASTSTVAAASVKGIVRINAGGTFIPQITQSVGAAATVNANSYVKFKPVGSGSVTNVGNWS